MTRQTIAQAIAMLVVLWSVFRWAPADGPEGDEVFGRGDIQRMLRVDKELADNFHATLRVRAQCRTLVRAYHPLYAVRWQALLEFVRQIERVASPDDVVQLKGMPGNDWYMLAYYLYPLRCVGDIFEDGGSVHAPTLPEADWVLTGGQIPRMYNTAESTGAEYAGDKDLTEEGLREMDLVEMESTEDAPDRPAPRRASKP